MNRLTVDEGVQFFSQRHVKVMTYEVISVFVCVCLINDMQAYFSLSNE